MGEEYFAESNPHLMVDETTGEYIKVVELLPAKLQGSQLKTRRKFIFRIPLAWNQRATTECAHAIPVANLLWYRAGVTKLHTVTLPKP